MKVVEIYGLFGAFSVDIAPEDLDTVNGIQMRFNNMVDLSNSITKEVDVKQVELNQELKIGLSEFPQEIEEFNIDFETKGPMIEGLPAKEASDRVRKRNELFAFIIPNIIFIFFRHFFSKHVLMIYGESMKCSKVGSECTQWKLLNIQYWFNERKSSIYSLNYIHYIYWLLKKLMDMQRFHGNK